MRVQRHLSLGLAVASIASMLTVSAGSAVAASSTSTLNAAPASTGTPPTLTTAPASTEDYTRPDLPSARLAARLLNHRVEITGLEAEMSTTWVNADGTMTSDISASPVREQVNGAWQHVDATLVATPQGIVPKVAKIAATFSGGGTQPLYTVQTGAASSVSVNWPGQLPAPTLAGNVATYHDVQPGVDVVVTAGVTGLDVSIVLTARPSVAPLFRLPITLAGSLSSLQGADGVVHYKDASGEDALVSDSPRMWGAARTPVSGQPAAVAAAPTGLARGAGGSVLTVSPGMSFLNDPSVVYPVTIDPGLSLTAPNYTFIDSYSSNVSFFDNNMQSGTTTGVTIVGGTNGSVIDRAFYQFNTAQLAGTTVTGATLSLQEVGSGSCTPEEVDVWDASNFTSASTWINPPTVNNEWASTVAAAGYSSACPAGTVTFDGGGTSGRTITGLAQAWASSGQSQESIEVRSPNEANAAYWKVFAGAGATMSVTYNSGPGIPSGTSLLPCASACGSGYTKAWTNTTTPTLYASAVDPSANSVQLQYQVWTGTATSPITQVASGSTAFVPSGASASWSVPFGLLSNATAYVWRVQSFNGTSYSLWSSWMAFAVDTTAPAVPVVSGFGSSLNGTVNWSDSSTDIATFGVAVDGGATSWLGNVTSDYVSLNSYGYHIVTVSAQDFAGNTTAKTIGISASYAGEAVTSPADQSTTQRTVNLASQQVPGYGWVTYEYRLGTSGILQPIPLPSSGPSPVTVFGTTTPVNSWPQSWGGGTNQFTWNMASTVPTDGLVQVEACFTTNQSGGPPVCSMPNNVQLTTHAFSDSDATAKVGPGTVALLTGDYAVSATDASVPTYRGALTFGRTFTTLAPSDVTASPATGVLGPGWRAALYGPSAGQAAATFVDNSANGYVTLIEPDRTPETFNFSSGTTYTGLADTAAKGWTITQNSPTQYTLTEPNGTQTVYTQITTNTGALVWVTSQVTEASGTPSAATTTYSYDTSARVAQILAPIPAGISCTPTLGAGCRAMLFNYALTTTAVTGTPGDYANQLRSVNFLAYDPVAADPNCVTENNNMCTIEVTHYAYDTTGHLVNAWDPRITPNLKATYTYDSTSGRLMTLTPAGLATTSFGYDSLGRISTVSHPDPSGPTATSTIVYGDKLPFDSTGPIDLSPGVVAAWGEGPFSGYQNLTSAVTAAAVFGPDHVPAATPASADWPYASLTYMDANGRPVNTATYGNGAWQVSVSQFDVYGNVIWSITPGNLAQAITPVAGVTDAAVAAIPGVNGRVAALATVNSYEVDPSELYMTLGPTHLVQTPTGLIDGRDETIYGYDGSGQPAEGAPHRLVTVMVRGAQDLAGHQYDEVASQIGYAALVTGDTTGWALHRPTTTYTTLTDGTNLLSCTRYNSAGQVIETRSPSGTNGSPCASPGGDAFSTATTYYTAGTTGTCVSNALAGLLCSTGPAGQPATGKPLPVTTTTYNMYDEPLVMTETAGAVVRTTTSTYDAAGRKLTSAVTVTPAGSDGTATPSQTFGYDAATGLPKTVTDSNGKVVTTGYDSLGRAHTYTDATGAVTTTSYDLDGRPTTVVDPKGTTTYAYDGTAGEHRGVVTSSADSLAGTFNGTYTNDGQLATQSFPGGLTATYSYDNAGHQTQIAYAKSGTSWITFTATRDEGGRIVSGNNAAGVTSTYSYDNAGRLTTATDNTGTSCNRRAYGFNPNSDRTGLATSTFAPTGGACTGSGTPTTVNHSYDQADRITDAGYSYDDFGRTLTVPSVDAGGSAALTLGYYTNDLAQSVSQTVGGVTTTKTYGLDPTGRVLTEATGSSATTPGAPTAIGATAGNASASVSWTAPASNGGSTITAYVVTASPGGASASTTSGTAATVNGLSNGTAYTFTVQAVNAIGVGASSPASSAVTPANGGTATNTGDGGTAGTTVTTSNSGGASGTAFTVVAKGTGASLMYASAAAAHGTLGYSITGTSGTATYVGWNGYNASSTAVRFYYNPGTALPSQLIRLMDIRNATGTAARVELSAANQLFIQNNAGTTITTFSHALQANTWYRIEMTISVSGTAATIKAAYYPKDGTTPVDPAYSTTTGNTGTANVTQVSIGSTA